MISIAALSLASFSGRRIGLFLRLFLLAVSLPCLALASAVAGSEPSLQAYLSRLQADSGSPGVSAAVMLDGACVFAGGVGLGDLEHDIPLGATSVHNIGSLSKIHALIAVLQLWEQGKLDLDEEIQAHVPWFPKKAWPVTVRQILTHTSGIRHYKNGEFGPDEVMAFRHYKIFEESTRFWRDDPLLFQPGTQWYYSSYACNLLQAVVESASGQSFENYLKKNVWEPAGMLATQFDVPSRIVPGRSYGYGRSRTSGQLEKAPDENVSYKYAGGGILSTDEDMCRFVRALQEGRLLSPKTMAEMYRLQLAADVVSFEKPKPGGNPVFSPGTEQALIWRKGKDVAGRTYYWHTGSVKGTRSVLLNFPEERLAISIHWNFDTPVDKEKAALGIAQFVLPAPKKNS